MTASPSDSPHPQGPAQRYWAAIRKVSTGEVRVYEMDSVYPIGETSIWEEGNYACDCNRALFFARAAGEEDPNVQCDDGAYRVSLYDHTGELFFQD